MVSPDYIPGGISRDQIGLPNVGASKSTPADEAPEQSYRAPDPMEVLVRNLQMQTCYRRAERISRFRKRDMTRFCRKLLKHECRTGFEVWSSAIAKQGVGVRKSPCLRLRRALFVRPKE